MELLQKVAPLLALLIANHQKVVHMGTNRTIDNSFASDGVLLLENPNGGVNLQA